MKNLFLIAFVFLAGASFSQTSIPGDSWKNVKQNGVGKLSIVYYECPKLIEDINGEPRGVCVDVLNDFVRYVKSTYNTTLELNFVSKQNDFGQFLNIVKNSSNVIGVSNTTISEERKTEMKFSPYYLKTPLVILTNKDADNYNNLKELTASGLAGQVEKETSYATFLQKLKSQHYPDLNIEYQSSTVDVVSALSKANKYFSVMDFTEYLGEVKSNPGIKRQPINLKYNVDLGFVMSKKSDWDALFTEFLNDGYRNSIPYKKAVTTNLGANFMMLVRQ